MTEVRSPFTHDRWPDVRPAIGTFIGLANFLLALRPRRTPPQGLEDAVKLATEAAAAFTNLPRVTAFNEIEGRNVSDAYWQSKEAMQALNTFVPDTYRRDAEFWYHPNEVDLDVEFRQRLHATRMPSTASLLAARIAWVAASLLQGGCAGRVNFDTGAHYDGWARSVAGQVGAWGVPQTSSARVERVWRFIVAAGRLPIAGQDDALLDAFEAALMAGADEFAVALAKS